MPSAAGEHYEGAGRQDERKQSAERGSPTTGSPNTAPVPKNFAHRAYERKSRGKARAGAYAVGYRQKHRTLRGEGLGTAEEYAVNHNERYEDAQRGIERRCPACMSICSIVTKKRLSQR